MSRNQTSQKESVLGTGIAATSLGEGNQPPQVLGPSVIILEAEIWIEQSRETKTGQVSRKSAGSSLYACHAFVFGLNTKGIGSIEFEKSNVERVVMSNKYCDW